VLLRKLVLLPYTPHHSPLPVISRMNAVHTLTTFFLKLISILPYSWGMAFKHCAQSLGQCGSGGGSRRGDGQPYEPFMWVKVNHTVQGQPCGTRWTVVVREFPYVNFKGQDQKSRSSEDPTRLILLFPLQFYLQQRHCENLEVSTLNYVCFCPKMISLETFSF